MTKQMTTEERALEERRAYQREYYRRNRKRMVEQQRKWREDNPEKVSQYNRNYWLKRAAEKEAE